jgi:hypothetical protein
MRNLLTLAAAISIAACGKDPGGIQPFAVSLAVISGDGQVDTVAQVLAEPIAALATDTATATAAPGVVVNWFRVVGTDTTFIGAGSTNDSGIARLQPTLATKAGSQVFVAWALDNDGRRAVFTAATATALPDVAAVVSLPGSLDTSVAQSQLTKGSLILVEYLFRDQFGNATWTCRGSASPASWSWDYVPVYVPNPPVLVSRDTIIVDGAERHFAALEVQYAAQPADWPGTQISVFTRGCTTAGRDSVVIHYDNLQ